MNPAPGDDEVRALRLRAQRLSGRRATGVEELVAALTAVQAQDPVAAALALRARSRGLDRAAVDRARDEERSVVWTCALRGTLHLVAADDVGWLVGLLGPIFVAAGRPRRLALGLDDDLCERALVALRGVLAEAGPLPRAELVARLADHDAPIAADGQAPAHLVAYAALRGVVCRVGPASAPRYALLDEWLGAAPAAMEPDRALATLAERYLDGHAPAGPADLATWSGIGLRRARRAFELVAGTPRAAARPPRGRRPHAVLLGHFDPYLLGYADRGLVLDERFAKRIQAGGGFIQPAILVDGKVAGTWSRRRRGERLDIALEPFEDLPQGARATLAREAADVARFLAVRPADMRTCVRSPE